MVCPQLLLRAGRSGGRKSEPLFWRLNFGGEAARGLLALLNQRWPHVERPSAIPLFRWMKWKALGISNKYQYALGGEGGEEMAG